MRRKLLVHWMMPLKQTNHSNHVTFFHFDVGSACGVLCSQCRSSTFPQQNRDRVAQRWNSGTNEGENQTPKAIGWMCVLAFGLFILSSSHHTVSNAVTFSTF